MHRKLSPQALSLARSYEPGSGPVDLLIACISGPSEWQRQALQGAGASVRTSVGDVVTASALPAALEGIAALDFVVAVDVSGPLWLESPAPASRPEEDS